MALTIRQGTVSHLSEGTTTIARNGNMSTKHSFAFRVNGTPVTFKSSRHMSIDDGDRVTVAGKLNKGTFYIYAIRNETTGATTEGPLTGPLVIGILFLCAGIPLSVLLVGIPLVIYGCVYLHLAYMSSTARGLLNTAPYIPAT